jgi:hypothetical protein
MNAGPSRLARRHGKGQQSKVQPDAGNVKPLAGRGAGG